MLADNPLANGVAAALWTVVILCAIFVKKDAETSLAWWYFYRSCWALTLGLIVGLFISVIPIRIIDANTDYDRISRAWLLAGWPIGFVVIWWLAPNNGLPPKPSDSPSDDTP